MHIQVYFWLKLTVHISSVEEHIVDKFDGVVFTNTNQVVCLQNEKIWGPVHEYLIKAVKTLQNVKPRKLAYLKYTE